MRTRATLTFPLQTVHHLHMLLRDSHHVTLNGEGIFLVDEVHAVFSQKVYVCTLKDGRQ